MNNSQQHPINKQSYFIKHKLGLIFLFGILGFVYFATIFPSIFGGRKAFNEGYAVSSLRTFYDAQARYLENTKKFCGTLDELSKANFIDENLGAGQKSGYNFVLTKTENICALTATPVSSWTGRNSFFISTQDDGEIHFSNDQNKPADLNSPLLKNQPLQSR